MPTGSHVLIVDHNEQRTGTRAKATENFWPTAQHISPSRRESTTRSRDCPEFKLPTHTTGGECRKYCTVHTVWQTIINNSLREYEIQLHFVIRSVCSVYCTCTLVDGGCGFQWHGNCHCRSRALTPIFGFIDDWDSGVILRCCAGLCLLILSGYS
ncbi:hypothetical protein BO86DRAFT_12410 [Aspergillus japonicus CBS 114.51]|uniref:Uncharacterized protein n=1 Tax=Aspergillus japonicus CBS 114.51 TaxID=1448312 RepID=A0A8T8X7G7_ASPJA|nr:hypothetical protein BO86DRAFT_12410 [Aspergillus japonicus CBS 114.51]RAH84103.1 hypothetical protein BO86DRAFT_12410 [Aspergillus japonicus CBS 114.51]